MDGHLEVGADGRRTSSLATLIKAENGALVSGGVRMASWVCTGLHTAKDPEQADKGKVGRRVVWAQG